MHRVQILAATLHGNNDVKEGWGSWVSQEQQWPEQFNDSRACSFSDNRSSNSERDAV